MTVRIGVVKHGNKITNAIAAHVHETEHPIDWDSARVIEGENTFFFVCRKIKGSLHTKCSVNCINTDPGYHNNMYPVWFITLHMLYMLR